MAEKKAAATAEENDTKHEPTAAEKEAARAEAQRVLALRLRVGPVRDPE
jgi:hypothetical protein